MMTPVGLKPDGPFEPQDFLGQHLEGGEQLMTFDAAVVEHIRPEVTVFPDWNAVAGMLEREGFKNPVYKGIRENSHTFSCDLLGLDCLCCGFVHERNNWWVSLRGDGCYSDRCQLKVIGEPNAVVVAGNSTLHNALKHLGLSQSTQHGLDRDNKDCMWVTQHVQSCPTCAAHHDSDLWYIHTVVEHCYTMRNAELSCQPRLLATDPDQTLAAIIRNPTVDIEYVELFLKESKNTFKSVGTIIYRFTKHGWEEVPDQTVQTLIQNFLRHVFWTVLRLVEAEQTILKACPAQPMFDKKYLKDLATRLAVLARCPRTDAPCCSSLRSIRCL